MDATREPVQQTASIQWRPHRRLRRDAGKSTEFAANYLEIARLLLDYGRTELARRRLQRVVEKFGNTPAGQQSRDLLATIQVASGDNKAPDANRAVKAC